MRLYLRPVPKMLVASSWSIMSSLRLAGFLSLASRCRRSRSRRRWSRSFFSSSVKGFFSASMADESEFLRGRRSVRRCGDRESCGCPLPCPRLALMASSCDLEGRCPGGGPLRAPGGMFSLFGGGPRLACGGPASARGGAGASSPLMSGADGSSSMVKASFVPKC